MPSLGQIWAREGIAPMPPATWVLQAVHSHNVRVLCHPALLSERRALISRVWVMLSPQYANIICASAGRAAWPKVRLKRPRPPEAVSPGPRASLCCHIFEAGMTSCHRHALCAPMFGRRPKQPDELRTPQRGRAPTTRAATWRRNTAKKESRAHLRIRASTQIAPVGVGPVTHILPQPRPSMGPGRMEDRNRDAHTQPL